MAVTIEEILLERERRRGAAGAAPSMTLETPTTPSLDKYNDDLSYLRNLNESYTPEQVVAPQPSTSFYNPTTPPGLPAPETPLDLGGIASSIKSTVSPYLETLGKQEIQQAELGRAQAPAITGIGEAALSTATGLVGGGIGLLGAAEEYIRNPPYPYPKMFSSEEYNPPPVDANYWKNLTDKARKIGAEFTYEPRTPEGKAAVSAISPAFEALHAFSERASEAPLMRMAFTPDQRKAVSYAHELVTMVALGELGSAAKGFLGRARIKEFQDTFLEASKEASGGPATEKLSTLAEYLSRKAEESPEISAKFNPERVASLREKQSTEGTASIDAGLEAMERVRISERDPTLMPRMREQGKGILDRLNENPENEGYRDSAIAFFEKTRGSGDRTIETLRSKVNESLGGISEPSIAPIEATPLEAPPLSPTPAIRPSRRSRTQPKAETPFEEVESAPRDIPPVEEGYIRLYRTDISRKARESLPTDTEFTRSHVANQDLNYIRNWRDVNAPNASIYYIDVPWDKTDPMTPSPPPSITPQQRMQLKFFEGPAEVAKQLPEGQYAISSGGGTSSAVLGSKELLGETSKSIAEIREAAGQLPRAVETEATLSEVIKSPSRRAPSKRSAEEKIQAIEDSNAWATKESTIARIQDSLEKNVDITQEIRDAIPGNTQSQQAVIAYNRARMVARNGIDSSNRRGIMQIVQDIGELFAFDVNPNELGAFGNIHLSYRQKVAAQRLVADAYKEYGNALKAGEEWNNKKAAKFFVNMMEQRGIDPVTRALYDDYISNQMIPISPPSGVGPKNMHLDGKAMDGTDPIIERHVQERSGKLGVPMYEDGLRAFQSANIRPDPSGTWGLGWETPRRTFKSFSEDIYKMVFDNYGKIQKAFTSEVNVMQKDLRRLEKLVKYSDRKAITEAVEEGNPASLKGQNRQVHGVLESGVTDLLNRANEVRDPLGIEPLPESVFLDPVGFMRAAESAKSNGAGINIIKSSSEAIQSMMDKYIAEPMKPTFTQRRLGLSSETDIFRQFGKFATSSLEQINVSPLTEALREHVNHSHIDVVKMDGSQYSVARENPGLHRTINEWANFVDGMPIKEMNYAGKSWDPYLRKFNENIAWSMLSANLRSVMAQPASLVNTLHSAGIGNTLLAIGDSFASVVKSDSARMEAISSSRLLSSRKNQSLYGEIIGSISEGMFQDIKRMGKETGLAVREGRTRDLASGVSQIGMTMLESADYEAAIISWNAFKRQGEKMGLRGEDLISYADDGLVSTQASGARGDLSPIQRSALGRTLTQFQTFTLSDWNFIINEVIKPKPNASRADVLKSVGRFIGISTAVTGIYEALGIDSPLPNPIKAAYQSSQKGDNVLALAAKVAFEATPNIPVYGGAKYGKGIGGPLLGTALVDVPMSLLGRPGSQNILEPTSKLAGIPTSSTWWKLNKGGPETVGLERLFNSSPESPGGGSSGIRRNR